MNNDNEFISWDGSFDAEESQFVLLPEGKYPFQVTGMERKNYEGKSEKIPNGCPYAEVSVNLFSQDGKSTTVKERLYLLKKFQWKLTQFFISIGQPVVVGQPFKPNWSTVIGSKSEAEVTVNQYTGSDGQDHKNNRIKEFLKPKVNAGVVNQTPTQPQQPTYQPGTGAF